MGKKPKNANFQRFVKKVAWKLLLKLSQLFILYNEHTKPKKIHSSSIPSQKYCTNTSKSARFGAKISQISNSCVSIQLKVLIFSIGFKLGPFIYVTGMALIAF